MDMKKTYEKPVLLKKDRLSAVTAGNGGSTPIPQ
ncbi:putative RiPP precursor [Mesorhizobium sp. M4B.F.Ca.ET.215.01.1.1]|nr:putative RiPP precursor [Mesorhizobium sp. M4B.F.Ca.ET.013.02.1.1]RUW66227.1 putative RiPP precursor [Mesorhizobium sp. M4B.F.Ca.ET.049.02.1.2]RVC56507.1 putative RiPP precursor [Mesorhizobium sp. M4B.F.Ca.ET.088.02.2.1]RVD15739.1 putative RiPP precursor [Mesorhizobium sp. M4B.F.Ca.ET.017.02.2.1]RVD32286.1 putative RiPP precursor [Mesorhizobium sp. M4B.F.Ca.ET.019.03.1.1]RWA60825.1 MAG: putative RiPP precursor [Mesorhizobium sp.]RWX68167.1 putative RiPP precursor [Mesorhizobium sp. M4B.F.C